MTIALVSNRYIIYFIDGKISKIILYNIEFKLQKCINFNRCIFLVIFNKQNYVFLLFFTRKLNFSKVITIMSTDYKLLLLALM